MTTQENLLAEVREHYTAAAQTAAAGSACCTPDEAEVFGASQYADIGPDEVPAEALLASLGCGNPTAVAALNAGETVLDLGSGGGTDVILSARRVGPTGKVYGLDFLDEMLLLARKNVQAAGVGNVELLRGMIEAVPLPADTVDVAISNCVINLSLDKPAVFTELFRVLKPGGRLGISDVVADDALSPADRAERGGHAECIAGALSFAEYHSVLAAAGFTEVTVTATHSVADGMHGAIVQAVKPAEAPAPVAAESAGCCG